KKEKETFFLYNGKEAVRIGITKKNDASPITLSKDVKKMIQNLEDEYSPLFSFVILEDLSEQVTASLFSLILSGLIGIGVTFSVVLFFLKSFNIAFLLSSVIPLCAALCIATLNICGCTVNIMSLSGIAVGIGMVVDAGSVALENLERKKSKYGILNKNHIVEAVMEIAMSNTGSAITSIIVFLPVFFLDGILGEVFFDMAVSIVCAISTSCILSLTYIPALYSVLPDKSLQKNKSDRFIRGVEKYYDRILGKILKKKYLAFIPFFICVATGLICVIFVDFELLPEIKSGTYQITLDFPQGTQIKSMEKIAEKLSSELNVNNAIYGGMESEDYQRLSSVEERFETIVLTLKTDEINQNSMQIINQIALQHNASVKISEKQDMLSILLNTYKNKNIVSAKSVKELNKKIEGFNLQDVLPMEKAEEISFVPDRLFCSRLFTNPGYVASVIKNNLDGIKASDFYVKGRIIPIIVKLDCAEKFDSEAILDLNVKINNSNIPFGYLGKFTKQENEKVLFRYNRKDSKIIRNVTNDELEKFSSENKIDYFNLAKIETEEMLSNGFFLLIICGLLLYFAMGCQFQSFLIPLLLLIAIPPAFSGAVIFLFIFNQTLNVYGVIALVILFGTSVNNSILLYENCIQIKSVRNNSILSACRKKIRGILVTNTTTIFALIPFAIDFSGRNSQVSMSLCIIGGLIFSTIIVLTLIPIIFSV
ncbi:MAG: efflux RND transporter permease subunit, partial [Spirochaetaceae bacterium]|nr:efflux RND transporter permease subunit [Spirochaetaceae bacterium]